MRVFQESSVESGFFYFFFFPAPTVSISATPFSKFGLQKVHHRIRLGHIHRRGVDSDILLDLSFSYLLCYFLLLSHIVLNFFFFLLPPPLLLSLYLVSRRNCTEEGNAGC